MRTRLFLDPRESVKEDGAVTSRDCGAGQGGQYTSAGLYGWVLTIVDRSLCERDSDEGGDGEARERVAECSPAHAGGGQTGWATIISRISAHMIQSECEVYEEEKERRGDPPLDSDS